MRKGQEDSSRKDDPSESSEDRPADSPARPAANRRDPSAKQLRWFASVLGLLGAVLAIAVPFLPVEHDVNTLRWPTAQGTESVSAPLVSFEPLWMNATVPCLSLIHI